jgi:hypothetical protein
MFEFHNSFADVPSVPKAPNRILAARFLDDRKYPNRTLETGEAKWRVARIEAPWSDN